VFIPEENNSLHEGMGTNIQFAQVHRPCWSNSITDFSESRQSDYVSFSPKKLSTTPTSQKVEYFATGIDL